MTKQKTLLPFDCPRCRGRCIKSGFVPRKGGQKQRYQCTVCGYPFCKIPI